MKTKTIYHVESANVEFFFNEKGKMLHWWNQSDANYCAEYMNPLFSALGFKVEEANDERFKDTIKHILLEECGFQESDI